MNRLKLLGVTLLLTVSALAVPAAWAPPAFAGEVVAASADAHVKADDPTANFGTASPIRVDGSPVWNGYVKFAVPANGTVQSATLRLTAASSSSDATLVNAAASTWTETGLTYNNAPGLGTQVGSIPSTVNASTYSVDVTAGVTAGGDNTFVLSTAGATARTFYSRESGTTTDPELEVVFVNEVDTVHTMANVEQDAVNGSQSTKMRFEGRHGGTAADPYMFDLTVNHVSGNSDGMNLVFREQDDINFYQLDLEETQVLLREKIAGTIVTQATGCDGWVSDNQSYHVKMLLKGNVFEVYQGTETTPCVTWTDTDNTFPTGENASYYCMPGNYCIWERVEARPESVSPQRLAWNFTGQDPGYYSAQTINPSGQSILESRFPYTVERYRFGSAVNGGTGSDLDHVEHAADGNVEYHLDQWSEFGTKVVYRATVGQYGYHLELLNNVTRIRKKIANGTYTTMGTTASVVPVNRHVMIKVDGDRHRLIDEDNGDAVLIDFTDTSTPYTKGNKTYWGNTVTPMGNLLGSFRALP